MKAVSVFVALAAAALASAQQQGHSSEHSYPTGTTTSYYITPIPDSRTVNVGTPTPEPTTAITSLYTITSECGSVTVYKPGTAVYPLPSGYSQSGHYNSANATISGTPTYSATLTATPSSSNAAFTGGASANKAVAGTLAGFGLLVALVL